MITQDHEYDITLDQGAAGPGGGGTGTVDEELFQILKDLRKKCQRA